MARKNEKPFIRSVFDLGDYNDDSVNKEPSMTDPSQDETIDDLVARMIRGELVGGPAPVYDYTAPVEAGEAFAAMPAPTLDGFDISDVGPILARGEAAMQSLKQQSPAPEPVKPATEPEQPK